MYLRFARRRKDGKEHRYWSIVESRRGAGGRVVQRPVLYLGEINDGQREAWCRQIEAFDEASGRHRQLALFPAERAVPDHAKGFGVQVRLDAMALHRPRQWGACWLACHLYEQLQLDRFFAPLLPNSREGTNWQHILQTLVCYRLIDPGSEWRLHRQWFEQSAMADCLARIMRWSPRMRCIAVSINCCPTRRRCFRICGRAGRICSRRSSTCCCMTSPAPISSRRRRTMKRTSAAMATAATSAATACRW